MDSDEEEVSLNPLGLIENNEYQITRDNYTFTAPFLAYRRGQYIFNIDGVESMIPVRHINLSINSSTTTTKKRKGTFNSSTTTIKKGKETFNSKTPVNMSSKDTNSDTDECMICKGDDNKCLTKCPKCSAQWHNTCINHWLKIKSNCPQCNVPMSPQPIPSQPIINPDYITFDAGNNPPYVKWAYNSSDILPKGSKVTVYIIDYATYPSTNHIYKKIGTGTIIEAGKEQAQDESGNTLKEKYIIVEFENGERQKFKNGRNDNVFKIEALPPRSCTIMGGRRTKKRRRFLKSLRSLRKGKTKKGRRCK
jgi:hypothetical protein